MSSDTDRCPSNNSTDTDVSLPSIERDLDFWYTDGNVVVVAQQVAFRVHRGLLARQSYIFRDLFIIPTPTVPAQIDVIDGCPVVCVSDSSNDFWALLRVIYWGPT